MAKEELIGTLVPDIVDVDYNGESTETADVTVDNYGRKIKADVKKVPYSLTITQGEDVKTFDGSEDVSVTISSSPGGVKIYKHYLFISATGNGSGNTHLTIINTDSTPITGVTKVYNILSNAISVLVEDASSWRYLLTIVYNGPSPEISFNPGNYGYSLVSYWTNTSSIDKLTISGTHSVTDTVTEL